MDEGDEVAYDSCMRVMWWLAVLQGFGAIFRSGCNSIGVWDVKQVPLACISACYLCLVCMLVSRSRIS